MKLIQLPYQGVFSEIYKNKNYKKYQLKIYSYLKAAKGANDKHSSEMGSLA